MTLTCTLVPCIRWLQELRAEQCRLLTYLESDERFIRSRGDEMQNCLWLTPLLVAQIEFNEWTPDGHLRHATFAGLRNDTEPHEITRE